MVPVKLPLPVSYRKSCVYCKHFKPDPSGKITLGECKKYYVFTDKKGVEYHEFAIKMRDQKDKCGPDALFYENFLLD
jgi:hypothetical protein